MSVINSPSGQNQDELSSFHRGSPNPGILQMYLEEQKHNAIQPIHPLLKELIQNAKDKVVLDVEYMRHQSFWFDIKILWKTFIKVIRKDGVLH